MLLLLLLWRPSLMQRLLLLLLLPFAGQTRFKARLLLRVLLNISRTGTEIQAYW